MGRNRRTFIGGIGATVASLAASVEGVKGAQRNNDGFGRPTYVGVQDVRELEYVRRILDSDALVYRQVADQYEIQLDRGYWEPKIDHDGRITQEDFENSNMYVKTENELERQENRIETMLTHTRSAFSRNESWTRTVELGEDRTFSERSMMLSWQGDDDYESWRVVSGYGTGGKAGNWRSHVEVLPTGGYGSTWAVAENGVIFETEGNTSEVASFHGGADWEGYTFGTANNSGNFAVEFRLYDMEHDTYDSTEIYSHSLGNADTGTWREGSNNAMLTHTLQPNRTYRAVIHTKGSMTVRGSGSSFDFGIEQYKRSTGGGVFPRSLAIEF